MNSEHAILTLKSELQFLDGGGYRATIGHRQPLFCMETSPDWKESEFFEDSPTCIKKRYCRCSPDSGCVLMEFVPADERRGILSCHHIPLNKNGDTIASLAEAGQGHQRIESAVRNWLVETIARLEGRN